MVDPGTGLSVLIVAAGRGTRMRGQDKLLFDVEGQPVLRHLALQALGSGLPVFVAVPLDNVTRREALAGLPVTIVEVKDPSKGMSASLSAGIAALPRLASGAIVMLGDMPEVTTSDIARLADAFRGAGEDAVVRGSDAKGHAGHPVILPARLLARADALTGDHGARDLLRDETVKLVELPGRHATLDLDTPEDWAAWRDGPPEEN